MPLDRFRSTVMVNLVGSFNVANFDDKLCEAIPHDEVDLALLVAGLSLPLLMPAVERGGVTYTDAVWIQDANLLRIYVVYGYKPFFDLPSAVYSLFGPVASSPGSLDQYPAPLQTLITQMRDDGRRPLVSTAMARMQSDPELSDAMVSKNLNIFQRWE
jgi:hypothetical protein